MLNRVPTLIQNSIVIRCVLPFGPNVNGPNVILAQMCMGPNVSGPNVNSGPNVPGPNVCSGKDKMLPKWLFSLENQFFA